MRHRSMGRFAQAGPSTYPFGALECGTQTLAGPQAPGSNSVGPEVFLAREIQYMQIASWRLRLHVMLRVSQPK